jgi:putative salt-induced outer membrane protein
VLISLRSIPVLRSCAAHLRRISPAALTSLALLSIFGGPLSSAAFAQAPAAKPAPPPPDTVTLTNGDHLSGSVTQIDGGKLTLHTDYAGDVVISFDKVSNVKLQKAEVLSQMKTQGKKVDISKIEVVGIENEGKQVTVTTTAGATQTVPAPPTVRTPAAQQAFEDSLHPGWTHAWTTTANINFALARGNSDTTTLGIGDNTVRPTLHDKTSLYYNEIFTHDGLAKATTANNIGAGARYDHNVNPKLFVFGTGDFFEDQLQELDLRSVLGGGFGWHAIMKPKRTFDVLGGLVWTHETYSTVPGTPPTLPITNSFAALDFGEQYTQKFGTNSVFTEQAYIFPDLGDLGQYRATFNGGLSTKIKSFLSWQTTATDVYITNPPAGTKSNDLILTTGLGFTFTRK